MKSNTYYADDLDDLVHDKAGGWRSNRSEARRRQRPYKKRLTKELLRMGYSDDEWKNLEKQKPLK